MENQKGSSEGEDIPSDFFDDFTKDEFIEGLSVVDSWIDSEKIQQSRVKPEHSNRAGDLRDLIARDKRETIVKDKYRWRRVALQPAGAAEPPRAAARADGYIAPGSRRDPDKTKRAIKKDKEEKVKEYLAKHLEASDDIRPPGTELDDFFEGKKPDTKKEPSESKSSVASPPRETRERRPKYRRASPMRRRDGREPLPFRRQHWSPRRAAPSPRRFSPRRFSPRRASPARHIRRNPRVSPRRPSPDARRRLKSRSPSRHAFRRSRSHSSNRDRENRRRSRSRSRNRKSDDDFLYPKDYYPPEFTIVKPEIQYTGPPVPQYSEPMIVEYPGGAPAPAGGPPGFPFGRGAPPYGGFGAPYEYRAAPVAMQAPQPVPAPIHPQAITAPLDMNSSIVPAMMPGPLPMSAPVVPDRVLTPRLPKTIKVPPDQALAKLVADGILSHEDYLKLAPNKGASHAVDTPARSAVLNRINGALSMLGTLAAPARMIVTNGALTGGAEPPRAPPKFCSPLKRQAGAEFHFTRRDAASVAQRNKQVLELIVQTLRLESAVGKPRRKPAKSTRDAETQTARPFCDACEVRRATGAADAATEVDREHFSAAAHTQVAEHELRSARAADGAVSIAHMTPAQLVSQLAARAKTLKRHDAPPPPQPPPRADYDARLHQRYGNAYNDYRY